MSPQPKPDGELFRLLVGLAIAGQSMAIGIGINLHPPTGLPRLLLHGLLLASALTVIILLGRPLLENTWESLRDRELTVELLFVASLLGALAASLVSTLTGTGYVFYEVVAVVLVIYTFGRRLRRRTRERAFIALQSARSEHAYADVESGSGGLERRPVESVLPGSIVQVSAGGLLPIDGTLLSDAVYVDESSLTGEPLPVRRQAGDRVRAGTRAVDGSARIQVTGAGGRREIDRLFSALEEARLAPSEFQRLADRMTAWFLPFVLLFSAGTFAVWWWTADWKLAVFHSMAVLLVACPCALGMATPVAIWGGLAKLAKLGFAAKGGDFLDGLSRVDLVFLDKTGTLTESSASLGDWIESAAWKGRRSEVLALATAAEQGLPHPIAEAFGRAAQDGGRHQLVDRRIVPGSGVDARIRTPEGAEVTVCLGEQSWISEICRVQEPDLLQRAESISGGRRVWMAVDGIRAAVFEVRERLRPEAAGLAQALGRLGLDICILTGDARAPRSLAGIRVLGGLSPEAKLEEVKRSQAEGRRPLVVGDGLNDSPALAAAHTSIAIEGGSGLATGAAAAVASPGALAKLPEAILTARSVRQGIRGNLLFAASYNGIGMMLAAAGQLHPLVAALLMLVSSAIVSVRALRSSAAAGSPLPRPRAA